MMKICNTLWIVAMVVLVACSRTPESDKVLNQEKMVQLLTDFHLAEAHVNANFQYNDSSKFLYKHLEDSILKVYQTDRETFDSSMNYYRQHLPELDKIYAATVDTLNMKETVANSSTK